MIDEYIMVLYGPYWLAFSRESPVVLGSWKHFRQQLALWLLRYLDTQRGEPTEREKLENLRRLEAELAELGRQAESWHAAIQQIKADLAANSGAK